MKQIISIFMILFTVCFACANETIKGSVTDALPPIPGGTLMLMEKTPQQVPTLTVTLYPIAKRQQ
jgi:hypothetical protein